MTLQSPLALAEALVTASQPDVVRPSSIVLAVDGTSESDCAIELADTLGARNDAAVHVVSVAELPPAPVAWLPLGGALTALPEVTDLNTMRAQQLSSVTTQLRRVRGADAECQVTLQTGVMGREVAAFADTVGADLIVTGRGRHGMLDRLLGEEHLSRLLREAAAPVLAAEITLQRAPMRVAIATDFSAHSLEVARAALAVMDEHATIYLVHVKPDPPFGIPHPGQWLTSYETGVRAALDQMRMRLALPAARTVETVVLNGHPGVMLADFALVAGCDLLAIGVHGSGFWNRLVIGSVTNYLLRAAPCSLLAVPVQRCKSDDPPPQHSRPASPASFTVA